MPFARVKVETLYTEYIGFYLDAGARVRAREDWGLLVLTEPNICSIMSIRNFKGTCGERGAAMREKIIAQINQLLDQANSRQLELIYRIVQAILR